MNGRRSDECQPHVEARTARSPFVLRTSTVGDGARHHTSCHQNEVSFCYLFRFFRSKVRSRSGSDIAFAFNNGEIRPMSTRIVVDLPDHVYRRIESMAQQSRRMVKDIVAEVVIQSVRPFPVDANREDMLRETAAFHRLHPALLKEFPGQHVAILHGEIVDHDADPVALLKRIRSNYPDQTVLRRKVEPAPEPILQFRSPRITIP